MHFLSPYPKNSFTRRLARALAGFGAAVMQLALTAVPAHAATALADAPVFSVQQAPGNVALVLSVEYPTVVSVAYVNRNYSSGGPDYLGYFDPNKCYDYSNSSNPTDTPNAPAAIAASYFVPAGKASAHICTDKWSGHFLNWASMQTIDSFRWVMTGGYRVLDDPATTVLEKAWGTGQGGLGNFPDGSIPASDIAGATPFKSLVTAGADSLKFRIQGLGNKMVFYVASPPAKTYRVSYYNFGGTCTSSNFSQCTPVQPDPSYVSDFSAIKNNTSPAPPNVSSSSFGARYTASITVPTTGNYDFRILADDGARLYINNSSTPALTTVAFNKRASTTDAGNSSVNLTAGTTLSIRLDYYQTGGGAGLSFEMRAPNGDWNPFGALYSQYANYTGGTVAADTVYALFVRAKVCDVAVGLESNCVKYSSTNYKPQGLIQSYSNKLRFSALGYLNDDDKLRDGGVLRARQKFVGPTQPVPGSPAIVNPVTEWNPNTGVYVDNPDTTDANDTNLAFGTSVMNSGVTNYLNKFGELTHGSFKGNDPVSELFYAAVRYFRNLGNVPEWSNMSPTDAAKFTDGFPVITNWDDPILYGCQKNFIVGIGDTNTHADKNVPGNTNTASEPNPMPAAVSNDVRTPDAVTATNQVGVLEGLGSSLGTAPFGGDANSALMAGLAYDAHVNDIRPTDFLPATGSKKRADYSTIDTYWVDVQEGQIYKDRNQFYLATKYGGFTIPDNYTYNYGDALPSVASWHSNTDSLTDNSGSGSSTNGNVDLRPDHYFSGGSPDLMRSGLTAAFADIVTKQKPVSTSFSTALSQIGSSGNSSFSSTYETTDWSGEVTASELSFNANNDPAATTRWTLAGLLKTQLTTSTGWDLNRRVVTWNASALPRPAAVPFRSASISTAQQTALQSTYGGGNDSAKLLNYLRGDQTNEKGSAATGSTQAYRARTQLLGDIVDSKVVVVGAPAFPYLDATNPGYSRFKTSYASRPTVIYFGANDGMLHAINGSLASASTSPSGPGGTELFAYVPSALFTGLGTTPSVDGLASLGNPAFNHHFMVNATPAQYDVDFTRVSGATPTALGDWRSLLIGGLGKGGKSYYAIDVTDSSTFVNAAVAAASSTAAIANETSVAGKVLWEFSASSTVPLGYSFGDPIVAKTRKHGWVVVLPSGYNSSDGVGRLFLVNPKTGALLETLSTGVGDATNDAGLAQVNSFINDSTDGTVDSLYAGDLLGNLWRFDLTASTGAYPAPTNIAQLKDANDVAQPVTTAPSIAVDPVTRKRFVLVGTGRLLDSTDITSTQQQTFYAIADGSDARFNAAADLPKGPPQVNFPITRGKLYNNVSSLDTVSFNPVTQAGWYEDLGDASGSGANTGWRVIQNTRTLAGAALFNSTRPDLTNVCSPAGTSRLYGRALGSTQTILLTPAVANVTATDMSYYSYPTVITDQQFFSVAGTTRVLVGTSKGIDDPNTKPLPGQSLRRLNWRELRNVD